MSESLKTDYRFISITRFSCLCTGPLRERLQCLSDGGEAPDKPAPEGIGVQAPGRGDACGDVSLKPPTKPRQLPMLGDSQRKHTPTLRHTLPGPALRIFFKTEYATQLIVIIRDRSDRAVTHSVHTHDDARSGWHALGV